MARRTETVTENREVVTCDVCGVPCGRFVMKCAGCEIDLCGTCSRNVQTPLSESAPACPRCENTTKPYATRAKEQRIKLHTALKDLNAEWRAACRAGRVSK
jgi:hypothetical protein